MTGVFDRIRRIRRTGGPFSAEFRVRTATHDVKWVLTLGTLAPDEAGMMRGRGCYNRHYERAREAILAGGTR